MSENLKPSLNTERLIKELRERTEHVVDELANRSVFGQRKYRKSMDRRDLTLAQWAQHFKEEQLDGAEYAERVRRGAELLESARALLMEYVGESHFNNAAELTFKERVRQWLYDYVDQFGDLGMKGGQE